MDQDKSGKLRTHLQTLRKLDSILTKTQDEAMDTGFVITMMDEWKAIEGDCPGAVATFSNASFRVESLRAQLARAEASIVRILDQDARAPQSARATDFLGENPFGSEDPRHRLWRNAAVQAYTENARFLSKRARRNYETQDDYLEGVLEIFAEGFSIGAKWLGSVVGGSYQAAELYVHQITQHADDTLKNAAERCSPLIHKGDLVSKLRLRLLELTKHYSAEAWERARVNEEEGHLGAPNTPIKARSENSDQTGEESLDEAELFFRAFRAVCKNSDQILGTFKEDLNAPKLIVRYQDLLDTIWSVQKVAPSQVSPMHIHHGLYLLSRSHRGGAELDPVSCQTAGVDPSRLADDIRLMLGRRTMMVVDSIAAPNQNHAKSLVSDAPSLPSRVKRIRQKPKPGGLPALGTVNKREAAAGLGCTPRTIERHVKNGLLNPIKQKNGNRYKVSELRGFLQVQRPRQTSTK
jgi:hypothetical protein